MFFLVMLPKGQLTSHSRMSGSRAEMTSRAPERVLSRGVQATLKVRIITGRQKAKVGLAEEER